jgi:hypothetical protein
MWRCSAWTMVVFLGGLLVAGFANAQDAKPNKPLTCHKVVCPLPTSSCQTLESDKCVKGQCPAIVNVADGTSCNDGNVCTSDDVCSGGVCGGAAVTCSSPTDLCTPSTGCATPCGPGGCTVTAANGYLSPTLTVPAGALAADVAISMIDQGGDANDASVFHVYSFGPTGTKFTTPATVDLPAPPLTGAQIAVIEVSDDGTNWTAVSTTVAGGRVSGPIAHFSFCRTRAILPQASAPTDLIITDIVDYQDLGKITIPPPGEAGTCGSGDIYGLCFRMKNKGTTTITSSCPTTPTNPLPAGCIQMHVIPWQCYTASRDFPAPFDPANPTAYEGQHCDSSGLLIPCSDSIYNMDQFLPAGGLAPGQEIWVDLNFYVNPPQPVNNVFPYSCFGSSFMGFDLVFREPTCDATGTQCDWQGGIRSAKDGVFVEVPQGTNVWVPAGVNGCTPVAGKTTCQLVCTATTCAAKWDWLVNQDVHPAQYPTLRCQRGSTPIDCAQYQSGDVAVKNWLNDARF